MVTADEDLVADEKDDEFSGEPFFWSLTGRSVQTLQGSWTIQILQQLITKAPKLVLLAAYFRREASPKVLVTTNFRPSAVMFGFIAEMLTVLPCATYYKRQVILGQQVFCWGHHCPPERSHA